MAQPRARRLRRIARGRLLLMTGKYFIHSGFIVRTLIKTAGII